MAEQTRIKGLSIPFSFTSRGYPESCINDKALHDSVFTILSTMPGERVMRPNFGSYLRLILFENINRVAGLRARYEVQRALALWEPRISVQDVLFELNETTITVHVSWIANGTLGATTSLALPVAA
ncbi:MAG: GPW/gp25 family protein [Nitrospira sp.]